MDNALQTGRFPGYTLTQLKCAVAVGRGSPEMNAEIERREAIKAGDLSRRSPSERLVAAGRFVGDYDEPLGFEDTSIDDPELVTVIEAGEEIGVPIPPAD